MHQRLASLVGLFFLALASVTLRAQFYAPETEYHDMAQRQFVVELDRVLSWRENQNAGSRPGKIAEITYKVVTSPEHETTWELGALGTDGKSARDSKVQYSEALLTSGADFYRTVAKPEISAARKSAGRERKKGALTTDELTKAFWAGAEMAGTSRAESLTAAFSLNPKTDPKSAAKIAGLLSHATLPSLAATFSLDSVLLARAAAWLCIAESELKDSEKPNDALWAPILFLAARENAAAELWKKSRVPNESAMWKWWDFLLSHPRSREVFAFAAEPANRKFAMPMLVYQTRLFDLGATLGEVTETLYDDPKSLAALHDYSVFFSLRTGVGGGRITEGSWPVIARAAWIECLRKFKPDPLDFRGYTDALKQIKGDPLKDAAGSGDSDASLRGLAEAAPLINLGFSEYMGKLTPVAVVTARDLLNYGWEMTGAAMGARWHFVEKSWGVRDLAESIAQGALKTIHGIEPFFTTGVWRLGAKDAPTWKHSTVRLTDFSRLQCIQGPVAMDDWPYARQIFSADKAANTGLFARRCWLRPEFVRTQSSAFQYAKVFDPIVPNLRRLHAEGGPLIDQRAVEWFLFDLGIDGLPRVPGGAECKLELARALPEVSRTKIDALWPTEFKKKPPLERAQALEKLFWERPGSDLPYDQIFEDYLRAHAYESAKRFCSQIDPLIDERVGFSNKTGARRFALALLERDEAAMREARQACATGSYYHLLIECVNAAAHDDIPALTRMVDACLDRYPPSPNNMSSDMVQLKNFIPLIPALKDPKHAEREKALDYFAKSPNWLTLQWIWTQNYKLSNDDAVRFFGGANTDNQRQLVVQYLLKDKEGFEKNYQEVDRRSTQRGHFYVPLAFVVIHHLRNELLEIPMPVQQPDLKPPRAQSLRQAFLAKMKQAD